MVSGTEQVREGEGGRLGASVEAHGIEPLAGLLWSMAELEALELVDADVTLRLVRNGVGAALSVAWASGEVFEETSMDRIDPNLSEIKTFHRPRTVIYARTSGGEGSA